MDLFPGDLRLLTSTFFGGQAGYVWPSAVGAVLYESGSGVIYVTYATSEPEPDAAESCGVSKCMHKPGTQLSLTHTCGLGCAGS